MTSKTETPSPFGDDLVDHHLDAVLRASGSALRHYSMAKTIQEMREAMRAAMAAAVQTHVSGGGLL